MNRDQEKAMFAKSKSGPGIRKKQLSPTTKQTIQNVSGKRLKEAESSTIFGMISKDKEEKLLRQLSDNWNELPKKYKEMYFNDWMLYRQTSMNPDNELNWAKYNYGDISFDKLPETFKLFTVGSPYPTGMNYKVESKQHGRRYFKTVNDALIFGNEEQLEVLPIK